jgi:hypothetical protein
MARSQCASQNDLAVVSRGAAPPGLSPARSSLARRFAPGNVKLTKEKREAEDVTGQGEG